MEDIKQVPDTATEEITPTEGRTFTQAEVNAMVLEGKHQVQRKYADYEELKAKAAKFDEAEEASKSEVQKVTDKANALQKELDALKKQNAVAVARAKVSKATGVPVDCLNGEDEESCKAQAEAILKFAKPSSYPPVKKDTPTKRNSFSGADDAMRDFARTLFNK